MIAIIDYGMGNLRSVQKALETAGAADATITQKPQDIAKAEKIVLPGVGAIAPAMDRLTDLGLIDVILTEIEKKKPFLGICLGFQLLFEKSSEFGESRGLGILPGHVERFPDGLKIPQMGWNSLKMKPCPLWDGLEDGIDVYFCHSFYARPAHPGDTAAITDYGIKYCSAVHRNNIYGVQFHPEKSQTAGLKILENFINLEINNGK